MVQACAAYPQFSTALNGRFKGGYITRHYGQPDQHIHAIQLEMCQSLYMQEVAPFAAMKRAPRWSTPIEENGR